MRLKTIVKMGTIVSVLLFCLAVGYYAFMRLDMTEHNRDVNLFSLVPSSSISVLESDNINSLFQEYATLNYSRELDEFQFSGLFNFLISELNEYTSEIHGLSTQMSRLVVSFHNPGTVRDQVVYFRMGMTDDQMLFDMLQEYIPGNFLPKEDVYRGKTILVYPLSHDDFLAVYTEKGFVVLSYQKRLIEEVIDAQLDKTSLSDDASFANILNKKKTKDFLTLYTRTASMPFLDVESESWSEYNFHMNSDVIYLTGDTFISEGTKYMDVLWKRMKDFSVINEEGIMLSADKDSTVFFMGQAFEANDSGNRTLFNECVANLSNEALFSFVVDMEKVKENPNRFQTYLPPFILNNASSFCAFVLSVQLLLNEEHPSYIWVFTYKH